MNHFETAEHYFKVNQKFSTDLYKARLYETLGLAVFDVSSSLLQFLSHRPKVAVVRQGSSVFEAQIAIFLRQQTPLQFKPASQSIHQFIAEIDKETNFVLWSAENEITGEIIYSDEVCLEIHKLLSDKKIFSIQVVQANRNINKTEVLKNIYAVLIETANLFSVAKTQMFFTEKLKAPSLVGPFQNITNIESLMQTQALTAPVASLTVLEDSLFEKQFSPAIKYLNDRQTFLFKNCSGEFIMQCLIQAKAIQPEYIFAPSALPTWILDTFKNWWPEAENPALLMNLVVISNQAFLLNPELEKMIFDIYMQNQKDSSWSVD